MRITERRIPQHRAMADTRDDTSLEGVGCLNGAMIDNAVLKIPRNFPGDDDLPDDERAEDMFPEVDLTCACVNNTSTQPDEDRPKDEVRPKDKARPTLDGARRRADRPAVRFTLPEVKMVKTLSTISKDSSSSEKTASTAASSVEDVTPLEKIFICLVDPDFFCRPIVDKVDEDNYALPDFLCDPSTDLYFDFPSLDDATDYLQGPPSMISKNQKRSKLPKMFGFQWPDFLCNPYTDLKLDFEAPSLEAKDFLYALPTPTSLNSSMLPSKVSFKIR